MKRYFEGKQVSLKLDMRATKDGVNIYPSTFTLRPILFLDTLTQTVIQGAPLATIPEPDSQSHKS